METAFTRLRALQQRVLGLAARREFDAATRQLPSLHRAAEAVRSLSKELSASLAPLRCSGFGLRTPTEDGGGGSYWKRPLAMIAGAALLAGLAHAVRGRLMPAAKRRRGPKVNLD